MKLAFITDEITQSFDDAVRFAKAYRLDGLELRSVEEEPIDRIPSGKLRDWRRILDAEGLKTANLSSSFFKCQMESALIAEECEKLQRLCEAAEILGCDTIRGFAFFQGETPFSQALETIVKAFERPMSILTKAQKTLLLEADPSVYTTNHAQLARLLAAIVKEYGPSRPGVSAALPRVAAIYDPGNDLYDPCGETPYPEGYAAVRGWMAHVHIKDAVQTENGPECVRVGTGLVDYPGLLAALKRDGYAGWLSMETHYRVGRQISEEQMRIPQGGAFSQGGAEAMAESIESFRELLEQA